MTYTALRAAVLFVLKRLRSTISKPRRAFRRESFASAVQDLELRQLLSGQTIMVTVATDDTQTPTTAHMTLRDAVQQADSDGGGDTITFASGLSGQTITLLYGDLPITDSMTITGPGTSHLTIDGNQNSRIFDIDAVDAGASVVKITGLTLQHGKETAATVANSGGAIYNAETLTLTNDTIMANSSAFYGGAIYNVGSVTSRNDLFSGNSAGQSGGAIANEGGIWSSTLDTISGNTAVSLGGGIDTEGFNVGVFTSTSDLITGNKAIGGGGIENGATLVSTLDRINQNTAILDGGGIFSNGVASLNSDTISSNSVTGSSTSAAEGGGIINNFGTFTSTNDTIAWNTVNGSSTGSGGGGIQNTGTYRSTNDTITGNTVTGSTNGGGGVANTKTFDATNDTITANNAGNGGGVQNVGSASFNMLNSIVAGNMQGSGSDVAGSLSPISSHNVSGLFAGQTIGNILQTVPNLIPLRPLVTNNGGPTQTIAPASDSPANGAGGILAQVTATGDEGTTLLVNATPFVAAGDMLRIGSEIVQVAAVVNATTLTVLRAQDGTTQTNLNNQSASLAFDQRDFLRTTNDIGAVDGPQTTIVVTSAGDIHIEGYTTLREAIQQANTDHSGDTITFAASLMGGTIMLPHGELLITSSVTITGLGAANLAIDGTMASRIFDINANDGGKNKVTITGLTLQHGQISGISPSATGGAIYNAENLMLSNDTLKANSAGQYGGAVNNIGSVTSTDNTISGNSSGGSGGGIENSGSWTSTGDTISENSAVKLGGGIDTEGYNVATFTSTGDTITGNSASAGGGIENGATLTSTNDQISGNSAVNGGGIFSNGIASISGDTISTNTVTDTTTNFGGGGGIFNNFGMFTSNGDTISGNTASGNLATGTTPANSGGGIENTGTFQSSEDQITGNSVTGSGSEGGGVANSSSFTSNNDTIESNSAAAYGGGIYNSSPGTLNSTDDTITANTAGLSGGGMNSDGQVTSNGDMISLNSANDSGGGIANSGTWTSNADTISGNSAVTLGGGLDNEGYNIAVFTSTSDVIIGNTAGAGGGGIENGATLKSTDDQISGNSTVDGGGIFNDGIASIVGDTISNNSVSDTPTSFGGGGGIFNNYATFTSLHSTIVGNTASGNLATGTTPSNSGGGIENTGTFQSTNDTIANNSVTGNGGLGGGIANVKTFTITNDTIAGNQAVIGGGIDSSNQGTFNALNSIIVGNTAISGPQVAGAFSAVSGHNIGSIPNGETLANILQTVPGSNPLQPLVTDNGSATDTIALVPGSPAIGAAGMLTQVTPTGDGGTTLTVNSTTFIEVGEFLRIGPEIVRVTAKPNPYTLTVVRALDGTTQANLNGQQVSLAFDQRGLLRNAKSDLGAFETQVPTVNVTINGGVYNRIAFAVTNASVISLSNQTIAAFGDPSLTYQYYTGTLSAAELAGATPLSGPPVNVGDYTVVATFTSNVPGFRNSTSAQVYFSITPAPLTVSATTNTKVYDGTTNAKAVPTVSGLIGSDTVTGLTEIYITSNVLGTNGSTLAVSFYTLNDGNGGLNYKVVQNTATGTITPLSPALTLKPGPVVVIGSGKSITAAAGLAGGINEAGSITFKLTDPNNNLVDTEIVYVNGNGVYSASGVVPTVPGTYQWTASYSGDANDNPSATITAATNAVGAGLTVVSGTLYVVGGNSADSIAITPIGAKTDGSTGISVTAALNGSASVTQTFTQSITSINETGFGGNDTVTISPTIKIATSIYEGGGASIIRLGSGSSTVILGNGQNVVIGGMGTETISAGNGNNLIIGGLGAHTIQVGNGSNILIDGSVTLTQSGDSYTKVLSDWTTGGAQAANLASIRSRLSVTYNHSNANTLLAGTGLDWFWFTDSLDKTNIKSTDVLN